MSQQLQGYLACERMTTMSFFLIGPHVKAMGGLLKLVV
jgi:hypothetical protein